MEKGQMSDAMRLQGNILENFKRELQHLATQVDVG
jgi:hypothetical protein